MVYMYSIGDDAFTFSEAWAKEIKDKYEEQTVVVELDEFVRKIESGELMVNKFCFLTRQSSEVESKY